MDRRIATLAGIVGSFIGVAISIVWLLVAGWALSRYGIDAGDVINYWNISPNPAACWLAYGPLPFFVIGGFIALYSMVAEDREKERGLKLIAYIVLIFFSILFVAISMFLTDWRASVGGILIYGNMVAALLFALAAFYELYTGYRMSLKVQTPSETTRKISFEMILLPLLIGTILSIVWIFGMERLIVFLLSGSYGVDASYGLLNNDPALHWFSSDFIFFFFILSIAITYAIAYHNKPGYSDTKNAVMNFTVYAFLGTFIWLIFSIAISLLQIKIAPTLTESAGIFVVAALIFYLGNFAEYPGIFNTYSSSVASRSL